MLAWKVTVCTEEEQTQEERACLTQWTVGQLWGGRPSRGGHLKFLCPPHRPPEPLRSGPASPQRRP